MLACSLLFTLLIRSDTLSGHPFVIAFHEISSIQWGLRFRVIALLVCWPQQLARLHAPVFHSAVGWFLNILTNNSMIYSLATASGLLPTDMYRGIAWAKKYGLHAEQRFSPMTEKPLPNYHLEGGFVSENVPLCATAPQSRTGPRSAGGTTPPTFPVPGRGNIPPSSCGSVFLEFPFGHLNYDRNQYVRIIYVFWTISLACYISNFSDKFSYIYLDYCYWCIQGFTESPSWLDWI